MGQRGTGGDAPGRTWSLRREWSRAFVIMLLLLLLAAGANPNAQLKLLPPLRKVLDDRFIDVPLTIGATPLLRASKVSPHRSGFESKTLRRLVATKQQTGLLRTGA